MKGTKMSGKERQKHGFEYENKVINKLHLIKNENYTGMADAFDDKKNYYQIKCIKKGSSIELGDIFRNYNKDNDFILVIGFWDKYKNNIVEEYYLYIEKNKWNDLFSDFDFSLFKDLLKNITNKREDDVKWKSMCKEIKDLWNKKERYIQPRFKRDHKKQKRIQCAINNKDFYDYFLKEFHIWQK